MRAAAGFATGLGISEDEKLESEYGYRDDGLCVFFRFLIKLLEIFIILEQSSRFECLKKNFFEIFRNSKTALCVKMLKN